MTERSIFVAACDIANPAERAAYLDRACAGDPALRRHIEELLREQDDLGSFLDQPAASPFPTVRHEPIAEGPGAIIGRYKLLQLIGEGGFGAVYMAEQKEPVKRRVALKIIKFGMDTREVIARFEAERQALALMDHPNIAKVLDAGATDTGRPFFVMELVKGVPITEFCDRNQLSARDRLGLFVSVCQAVQHAHQKGIIHRDVKPSNVLVTLHDGTPVVKVIDFGVAKALNQELTEKTLFTAYGHMIGTPQYMSPEQAEMSGLDIDTRSDIYSLGVLLYELLTGTTPLEAAALRKAGYAEMQRLIREQEAPRPSQRVSTLGERLSVIARDRACEPARLGAILRGELDWIVLKALEKDRTRRYDTANGLARDVERFLKDEPVEACPPTLGYRLNKLFRKNRAAVATAAAFVALVLVAAVVGAVLAVQARRAEAQARRAEADAVAARAAEVEQREDATRQRDTALAAERETKSALAKLRLAQDEREAAQYAWDLRLVPLAVEAGNVAEVNRLLDRHIPRPGQVERRGFEWRFWHRQVNTHAAAVQLTGALDTTQPVGRSGTSPGLAVSADGARLAVFAPDSADPEAQEPPVAFRLRVWDVPTRQLLLTHRVTAPRPGERLSFNRFADPPQFSKDGKRIVINARFGVGAVRQMVERPGSLVREVLDIASGKVLLRLVDHLTVGEWTDLWSVALRADGRQLATFRPETTAKGHVHVWDVDTRREVCAPLPAARMPRAPFFPDGSRLVVIAVGNREVVVYDLAGAKPVGGWKLSNVAFGNRFTLSPNGQRAVGVAGDKVVLWDVPRGQEVRTLQLPGQRTNRSVYFSFSPDGTRLVILQQTREWDGAAERFEMTLCDPAMGATLPLVDFWSTSRDLDRRPSLAFSPDGKQVAIAGRGAVLTWDTATGKPLQTHRGHPVPVDALGYLTNSHRLWSLDASGLLKEWDTRPARPVTLTFAAPFHLAGPLFVLSEDGSRLASEAQAGRSRSVKLAATDGRWLRELPLPPSTAEPPAPAGMVPPQPIINALALSRDGRRVAALWGFSNRPRDTPQSHDLVVWDAETGGVLLRQRLEGEVALFVTLSPDGRSAVVGTHKEKEPWTLRVFDVDGRRERLAVPLAQATALAEARFRPDGRRLLLRTASAAEGRGAGKALVIDLADGQIVMAVACTAVRVGFRGFTREETGMLAWSPDGARFALTLPRTQKGAAGERRLRAAVHDAATGRILTRVETPTSEDRPEPVSELFFSADGRRLVGVTSSRWEVGRVRVWDASSGQELLTLRSPVAPGHVRSASPPAAVRHLAFGDDGHRLLMAETPVGNLGVREMPLTLTWWDATPVPPSEPQKP